MNVKNLNYSFIVMIPSNAWIVVHKLKFVFLFLYSDTDTG